MKKAVYLSLIDAYERFPRVQVLSARWNASGSTVKLHGFTVEWVMENTYAKDRLKWSVQLDPTSIYKSKCLLRDVL